MIEGLWIIVPIAADLELRFDVPNEPGEVLCGPDTEKACREVVREAAKKLSPRILTTATYAGSNYLNQTMGKVMEEYIQQLSPSAQLFFFRAPTFDTIGEVWATAAYIQHLSLDTVNVMFCVKSWHALRVWLDAHLIFRGLGLMCPIEIKPHAPANTLVHPAQTHIQELLKSFGSFFKISSMLLVWWFRKLRRKSEHIRVPH